MGKTNIFLGTELKLNINIEPLGEITMDDYDFEVHIFCSPKRVLVIQKNDAIRIDENDYVVIVDSEAIGTGEVKCVIVAQIPDEDFDDGLRKEVVSVNTDMTIVKVI